MDTDWILDEIATGLQKLYLLSLARTPAAELLAGTAQAWLETITTGRKWERDRDAPRFRSAFVTLQQTRTDWPAPLHFLDALPRVEQPALAYEVKPVSAEQATEILRKLRGMIGEEMPEHSAARAKREGPPLAAVEADLRRHYGADRKAAAAGDAS